MKSFILLCCLLATMCAAQRFPSNNMLEQAKQAAIKAKSNIQSVMSDIDRTKRNIMSSGKSGISNYYIQAYQNINQIQTTRNNYINEKAKEAKESGKNADDCLNIVRRNMNDAARTGQSNIQNCRNEAERQIESSLQGFDNEKANCQAMLRQLDSVALDCYNSNTMEMATCMTIKIGLINRNTRDLQQRVSQIEREAQSNKNKILLAQSSCNRDAISDVNSASSKAIYQAADCLKN